MAGKAGANVGLLLFLLCELSFVLGKAIYYHESFLS